MKVKMLTARTSNHGSPPQWGDVIEVSDDEGQRMIAAGQAVETAMLEGGENAVQNNRVNKKRN